MRLGGAAVALTGATFLGLLLSSAWCLESAGHEALVGLFAGAAVLFGMISSVLAWWPRASLVALGAGVLLSAAAAPFVSARAGSGEGERAEATRQALAKLGEAVAARQAAGAELPRRPVPAPTLLRELALDGSLPQEDGWGGTIRYRPEPDGWSLVARCRCGRPDLEEGHSHEGPAVVGPRADMVWRDGGLEPWPGELGD